MSSPNHESDSGSSAPVHSASERKQDEKQEDLYAAAYQFGWQSRMQYGRGAATPTVTFEKVEPELEKLWSLRQATTEKRLPWQAARDTARDAWNQVYDAIAGDSQAKTNG